MCLCYSKQKYESSHWDDKDIKEEDRQLLKIELTLTHMPLFLALDLL